MFLKIWTWSLRIILKVAIFGISFYEIGDKEYVCGYL